MEPFEDFCPIPEMFYSFETGEPFQTCNLCGKDLMEDRENYLIEKAFKNDETLFEYAMCWECREKMRGEISQQSMRLIDNYFDEHVSLIDWRKNCLESHGYSAEGWLSHCLVKGTSIDETEDYQIFGHFVDHNIDFSGFPYALSDAAMEDLVNLLSDKTLGFLNDTSNKLFGLDLGRRITIF